MRTAGLDIGSRSIELVVVDQGEIVIKRQADSGVDPLGRIRELLADVDYERIVATGYGRSLCELTYDFPTVTEIKAYGAGCRALFPEARTLLDIGGQDTKVIVLGPTGRVMKFEMNDKCAAGTGKFLEVMARALDYPIEAFGAAALGADHSVEISSMCTVFAESEVTGQIARGEAPDAIALGLHQAIARRAFSMIQRHRQAGPVVFAGGVANNPCMVALLAEALDEPLLVPDEPAYCGALGAALIAARED